MAQSYIPHGPLGMGGAPLGNHQAVIPDDVALATVQTAWGAGIRHFDTAPHYGAGLSEHRMGDVLRHFAKSDYTLSTKVGRILVADEHVPKIADQFHRALPFRRRVDYSHDGCLRSIEDSLQRLGLARIDIVYIHDCAPDWLGEGWLEQFEIAMNGAARALTRLRDEGVIKAWGFGVNVVDPCLLALQRADPNLFLVAGRYTLLDHTALAELLPLCEQRGAHVVLGGPYNSGLLAGGDTFNYEKAPALLVARTRRLAATCVRHGVDLKAAALQFCAAHPAVAAVIPGARTPTEVVENVAMMAQRIPSALWTDLKHEGLIPEHAPVPAPVPMP
jgi:D-threo-aldose 1-dehydrogenase